MSGGGGNIVGRNGSGGRNGGGGKVEGWGGGGTLRFIGGNLGGDISLIIDIT